MKSLLFCLTIFLASSPTFAGESPRDSRVLTKKQQDKLTPDEVIKRLKAGNKRFTSNESTVRDHKVQVRKAVSGQFPKAIVLSCVDSRVPVEDVFDQGIGDIFVARVAGNFVNDDILGSMEYASKVAGVKLIMVLGHESCGAVKSAVDDVKLGLITQLLAKIKPAIASVKKSYRGDSSSENKQFVKRVCHSNVRLNIQRIRKESKVIRDLEKSKAIKIIGGVYDMDSGKVEFIEKI